MKKLVLSLSLLLIFEGTLLGCISSKECPGDKICIAGGCFTPVKDQKKAKQPGPKDSKKVL